jgi:ketosteroid isomerase-like protein
MVIVDVEGFETEADAFNAHDLDALGRFLAEDVLFCAPGGIEGEGRMACLEFYSRWLEEFPDARLEVDTTQIVDDLAIEQGTFMGTHDGVARTGRSVAVDYIRLLRVRDGKFVSVKLIFDRLLMLEQLGLVPDAQGAS